jgi:hypothetical protein
MAKTIITPTAILSYPALFEARPGMNGGDSQFSATLVFPAGSNLAELKAAAAEAIKEKFGDQAAKLLSAGKLRLPFREDGAEKGYPEGSIFINCKSKTRPGVVSKYAGADGKPKPVTEEEIYPGCLVRASLRAFAYDTNGNKGASFSLGNVQKLDDGPRLDGRKDARDEFDAMGGAEPAAALADLL